MKDNATSLEDEILQLFSQLYAVTAQLLTKLREFEDSGEWAQQGAKTMAHWLNFRVGLSLHAAREKLRTARALAALPETTAAFARGRLSYSKVRALTRIATPENERDLLPVAESGTAFQVERI